jgi:alkanesulfonate monooxygenase SsuD/methylene tetrahydromethanopterin reductase-like flavin-dependent oxidoreductase (luciferase family)
MADKIRRFGELWAEERPDAPRPRSVVVGYIFVDKDRDRAREMAHQHIADYFRGTIEHYELNADTLAKVVGYDHYKEMNDNARTDPDAFVHTLTDQMFWGTPEDILEQIADVRGKVDAGTFVGHFTFADLPHAEVETSVQLFAEKVLPVLHSWNVSPLVYAE